MPSKFTNSDFKCPFSYRKCNFKNEWRKSPGGGGGGVLRFGSDGGVPLKPPNLYPSSKGVHNGRTMLSYIQEHIVCSCKQFESAWKSIWVLRYCKKYDVLFSSTEPKARVSYCRPFSSVVRRASSVVRKLLHFHLLLENAWLDFNQTWQESSLGVGDSKLFK